MQGASLFELFGKLRSSVPECSRLQDTELLSLINKDNVLAKQKLLALLFASLNIPSVPDLMEQRRAEKRLELKQNVAPADKLASEARFDSVFVDLVVNELQNLSFNASKLSQKLLTSKSAYLQVLSSLLQVKCNDKIKSVTPVFNQTSLLNQKVVRETSTPPQKAAFKSTSVSALPKKAAATPNLDSSLSTSVSALPKKAAATPNLDSSLSTSVSALPTKAAATPNLDSSLPASATLTQRHDKLVAENQLLVSENLKLKKQNADLENTVSELSRLIQDMTGQNAVSKAFQEKGLVASQKALDSRKQLLYQCQISHLHRQLDSFKQQEQDRDIFLCSNQDQLLQIVKTLKPALNELNNVKQHEKVANSIREGVKAIERLHKSFNRGVQNHISTREDNTTLTQMLLSDFVLPKPIKKVVLSDYQSDSVENLNLKHVARLESNLCELYKHLTEFESYVYTWLEPHSLKAFEKVSQAKFSDLKKNLTLSMDMLLSLSCIVPMAPLPKLEKVYELGHPEIPSIDMVLRNLNVSPAIRSKIEQPIYNLVKAFSNDRAMFASQVSGLTSELAQHREIYEKYNNTISQVISKLSKQHKHIAAQLNEIQVSLVNLRSTLGNLQWEKEPIYDFLNLLEPILDQTIARMDTFVKSEIGL